MSHDGLPPPYIRTPRPRRILIIGGGIAGLAALKTLVEEKGVGTDGPFEKVELVERRNNIGGVWYVNDQVIKQEKQSPRGNRCGEWPVQIEVPHRSNKSVKNGHHQSGIAFHTKPDWPSPAYTGLRGNVLPKFLTLSGGPSFPIPVDCDDPFPTLDETQKYLESIAKPLENHIRYNMECVEVRELPGKSKEDNRWAIRLRDWNRDGIECTEYFDAVVLSTGWTDVPMIPPLPGIKEATSKGFIEHCKWYRGPESYNVNARIMVVGNANSGNDVAAQLASLRKLGQHDPIYRVIRHKAWDYIVSLSDSLIKDVPALQSVVISKDGTKLQATLVDGSIVENVDCIIFASGYEIAKIRFVHLLDRQPHPEEEWMLPDTLSEPKDWTFNAVKPSSSVNNLWRPLSSPPSGTLFDPKNNPERIPNLYWQFLHSRAATLALINACPTRIPFWTSDVQSHCLRAIWDGTMTAFPDNLVERLQYETNRIQWLAYMKETETERIQAATLLCSKDEKKGEYTPREHAGTPSFHSLGIMLDDYGPPLRQMAISARPEWNEKLPDWNLHAEERINMHKLRKVALEKRRDKGIMMN